MAIQEPYGELAESELEKALDDHTELTRRTVHALTGIGLALLQIARRLEDIG
jgi:hypothetical protein